MYGELLSETSSDSSDDQDKSKPDDSDDDDPDHKSMAHLLDFALKAMKKKAKEKPKVNP